MLSYVLCFLAVFCCSSFFPVLPIIVEHRWDVLPRKRVRCVGDQKAGFTNRTVTDHNTLDVLHCARSPKRPTRPL